MVCSHRYNAVGRHAVVESTTHLVRWSQLSELNSSRLAYYSIHSRVPLLSSRWHAYDNLFVLQDSKGELYAWVVQHTALENQRLYLDLAALSYTTLVIIGSRDDFVYREHIICDRYTNIYSPDIFHCIHDHGLVDTIGTPRCTHADDLRWRPSDSSII
jgi:hypothetical protein